MWQAVCQAWVLIPMLAWLPGVSSRLSFPWWWGISSLAVIAVGLCQPQRKLIRVTGWWLLGCLAIFWFHQREFGMASKWLMGMISYVTAAHLIAERGRWSWIRTALLIAAVAQIPIVLMQVAQVPLPYVMERIHPCGSLGNRTELSILWGVASLLTTGPVAWSWALLSLSTGSATGSVPACMVLLIPFFRRWGLLCGSTVALAGMGTWAWLSIRLLSRLTIWKSILTWKIPIWLGYGFMGFPGGFTYDDPVSQLILIRDTHSVWLDWIVRTGVLGMVVGAGWLLWTIQRTRRVGLWPWFIFFAWIGTWQSLEGRPLIGLVGLVWMIALLQERTDAVGT